MAGRGVRGRDELEALVARPPSTLVSCWIYNMANGPRPLREKMLPFLADRAEGQALVYVGLG